MRKDTYTLIQHIPAYVSGVDVKQIKYRTLEGLLDNDFVKRWKKDKNFYRFSFSLGGDNSLLMVELNEGKNWYVVGYTTINEETKKLPIWEFKK